MQNHNLVKVASELNKYEVLSKAMLQMLYWLSFKVNFQRLNQPNRQVNQGFKGSNQ